MTKSISLKIQFLVCTLCFFSASYAQKNTDFKWFNPRSNDYTTLKGKAWQNTDSANYYTRIPATAEKNVRDAVWNLAKNTAGEYLDFVTNASQIRVNYQVTGGKSMENMVTIGVSGVDLYAQDTKNNWHWVKGAYSFGDTISFKYQNFDSTVNIKKYRLYLPLYNTPKWLKIGVEKKFDFKVEMADEKLPLVFYGTSIMQGASASRPGLAWSNILGRKLDKPVINLGFSGNGRLEKPLIDLMNEIDAQLFVLDCQPNLHDKKTYSETEIETRIVNAVNDLKQKHSKVPILLVEHSGGLAHLNLDSELTGRYIWTSKILANTYQKLKKEGSKNIFILTAQQIGFTDESTIDGTHPNDLGMMQYADAYQKIINKILGQKNQ